VKHVVGKEDELSPPDGWAKFVDAFNETTANERILLSRPKEHAYFMTRLLGLEGEIQTITEWVYE
jgi:hypothetical protein